MLVALLAALGVLSLFAHQRPFFAWDVNIAGWVLDIPGSDVDTFMGAISWPGNKISILTTVFIATAVVTWRLGWRAGLLMLSVALVIGVNEEFKELIDRPRPGELVSTDNKSFPSGHALYVVLLSGVTWLLAISRMSKRSHRLTLIAALVVWAVLAGTSRIYLEQHWPSDVLGGYLLGAAVLWVMAWIMPKLRIGQHRTGSEKIPPGGAS